MSTIERLAENARDEFEKFYRHKVDANADFQLGREYEDDRVYSGWAVWQHLTSIAIQVAAEYAAVVAERDALKAALIAYRENDKSYMAGTNYTALTPSPQSDQEEA